ncbi:MAG: MFS transporter [Victivallales bacterium]|nr:MFS transporter [Victivallales bacterium]
MKKSPLASVGFAGFIGTQFLGAFNDNVFKMLVICAATAVLSPEAKRDYIPLASALFILPYLLFSAFAGYLADRFSKRSVMIATKAAEIIIMLTGGILFKFNAIYALLAVLFCMGAQSAFFSPAKYGFLPETLPPEKLSSGNGATQLFTFLAIILGGWAGSQLSDTYKASFQTAALYPIAVAIAGFIISFLITRTRPGSPHAKPTFDPISPHWRAFAEMRHNKALLFCILGNTYFWFLGALFQANIPFIVQDDLKQGDQMIGYLQGAVALGIGIGSAAAGFLSKGKIAFHFVLPGGLLLAICAIAFGLTSSHVLPVLVITALLGVTGGFYQLPLNTGIQQYSPEDKRGAYLAAGNAIDCISMLLASALHWLLLKPLHLSPGLVIVVLGIITLCVIAALKAFMPDKIKKVKSAT